MISVLNNIGNRLVVEITCDECKTAKETNKDLLVGRQTFEKKLRDSGWVISKHHVCPSCVNKNEIVVKCKHCKRAISSSLFRSHNRNIGVDRFNKLLRERGWITGFKYVCPKCIIDYGYFTKRVRDYNAYAIRVSVDGECKGEVEMLDGQLLSIELLNPKNDLISVSRIVVKVGNRGGLIITREVDNAQGVYFLSEETHSASYSASG